MRDISQGLRHKAGHDPRAAALLALSRVLAQEADSQAALDGVLSSVRLVPTDKRLCTEIVYGSLRWYLKLMAFTETFLPRADKLPFEMRLVLITALYEMAFLRTPAHASVNWAARHIRHRFGTGLAGVANASLRAMREKLHEFNAGPGQPGRPAMPEWITSLWEKHYGQEAANLLLNACQEAPPAGLRLNRGRPDWPGLLDEVLRENTASASLIPPALLAFQGPLPWQGRPLISQGRASRQSPASYEALQAMRPAYFAPPIWDCCAGRGGKSLALLEAGLAVALASDPSARRLAGLPKEYDRLAQPGESAEGVALPPCPIILTHDAAQGQQDLAAHPHLPQPFLFGTILVDAPCSGLGTLARRPEIRLRRTPEDIGTLAALQKTILDAVWPSLRPGGQLVYITCTVSPAENEDQAAAFLARHAEARLVREFRTPFASPLREFFYAAAFLKEE